MHNGLMAARDHIYAHADHTAYRGVRFDRTGLPVPFESFFGRETFAEISAMCMELNSRYEAETLRLWEGLKDVVTPTPGAEQNGER